MFYKYYPKFHFNIKYISVKPPLTVCVKTVTHRVKLLLDEEIHKLWNKCIKYWKYLKEMNRIFCYMSVKEQKSLFDKRCNVRVSILKNENLIFLQKQINTDWWFKSVKYHYLIVDILEVPYTKRKHLHYRHKDRLQYNWS